MSIQAPATRWVGIIKQYYWNDTDEEMREIIEASISGWQSDVSGGTSFDPIPIRTIVGGIVLISTTYGCPGLFKDSIEKICSVVIRTQRIQKSNGSANWTSVAILSLLLPSTTLRRARLPDYENLLYDTLPGMDVLPRQVAPSYRIACAENEKMAEIDEISTIHLEKVIGKSRLLRAKSEDSPRDSQQSSPMDE
jgi:hypothetical protein